MKIIFSNLPMKKQLNQFRYAVEGKSKVAPVLQEEPDFE